MYGVFWVEDSFDRYSIADVSVLVFSCEISVGCVFGMEVLVADLGTGCL